MEDAEFLFHQTAKERKRNGYGDYHKKRGGGKVVRMPSDCMTRKEKRALNGEVKTYKMDKPITLEELNSYPDDMKAAYIFGLEKKYKVGSKELAKMFGVGIQAFRSWRRKWGCTAEVGTHTTPDWQAWFAFLGKVEETVKEEPPAVEEEPKTVKVTNAGEDVNNIARILAMLVGTGAKVTIEISL